MVKDYTAANEAGHRKGPKQVQDAQSPTNGEFIYYEFNDTSWHTVVRHM